MGKPYGTQLVLAGLVGCFTGAAFLIAAVTTGALVLVVTGGVDRAAGWLPQRAATAVAEVGITGRETDTPVPPGSAGTAVSPRPPGTAATLLPPGGILTPQPPAAIATPGVPGVTVEPPPAESLRNPEALARYPDPNISDAYRPLRGEDAADLPSGNAGPRLAIAGLNEQYTFNYGYVSSSAPATATLGLVNAGSEDLVVSRVYKTCVCLSVAVAGRATSSDGYLAEPLTLHPGQDAELKIVFDPSITRAYIGGLAQAFFLQVFSNDPSTERYVQDDPLSHEVRLRLVLLVPPVTPTPDYPDA